jgi:ElaB/YqjD/DUF883 family membrane-anchored ribosome-binding protein
MTSITPDPSPSVAQETSGIPAEVHEVMQHVQKIAESTSERLQSLADSLAQQTRERLDQGAKLATEHPLTLFGSAFAIGIAIGLLLPRR